MTEEEASRNTSRGNGIEKLEVLTFHPTNCGSSCEFLVAPSGKLIFFFNVHFKIKDDEDVVKTLCS